MVTRIIYSVKIGKLLSENRKIYNEDTIHNTSDSSPLMNDKDKSLIQGLLNESAEDIALVLGSIANRKRLQILVSLLNQPNTFKKLQEKTNLSKTALAHHLERLVETGLLEHVERGLYKLSPDGTEFLRAISKAYKNSRRRRGLEVARRADYIQKVHNKKWKKPNMDELAVRIVELDPMHIASARAISETPERDSWKKMRLWAEPKGLLEDIEKHPVFGFNNPDPSPGQREYGYEFWIRIEPEIKPEGEIQVKQFSGGLYAVTTCNVKGDPAKNIPETWHKLVDWVKSSNYQLSKHQWLEAHNPDASDEEMVLDLYCPIKK